MIADHIRACTFLIIDGVVPSNEGRGYVLRRIIRRAIRHGYKLGQTQPFFHKLVASVVREMGGYYTELVSGEARATQVLAQEEARFAETLTTGMALLDAETAKLTSTVIPGRDGVSAVRHLWFPAGSDGGCGARARAHHRSGGLRCRHGGAAGPRPRGQQVRHGTARLGEALGQDGFPGLRPAEPTTPIVTSLIFDGARR